MDCDVDPCVGVVLGASRGAAPGASLRWCWAACSRVDPSFLGVRVEAFGRLSWAKRTLTSRGKRFSAVTARARGSGFLQVAGSIVALRRDAVFCEFETASCGGEAPSRCALVGLQNSQAVTVLLVGQGLWRRLLLSVCASLVLDPACLALSRRLALRSASGNSSEPLRPGARVGPCLCRVTALLF